LLNGSLLLALRPQIHAGIWRFVAGSAQTLVGPLLRVLGRSSERRRSRGPGRSGQKLYDRRDTDGRTRRTGRDCA
jgi:hypothetical protein